MINYPTILTSLKRTLSVSSPSNSSKWLCVLCELCCSLRRLSCRFCCRLLQRDIFRKMYSIVYTHTPLIKHGVKYIVQLSIIKPSNTMTIATKLLTLFQDLRVSGNRTNRYVNTTKYLLHTTGCTTGYKLYEMYSTDENLYVA